MLVAVNRDMRVGDTFLLSLSFENSADQTIEVEVKQP
jgi:copper(I)-binding protein